MDLIKGRYFKVSTISKLNNLDCKVEDGLAIEQKVYDMKNSYFVVCFLYYNKKEDDIDLKNVGFRLIDVMNGSDDFRNEFIYSVNLAKNYLYYYMKIKNSTED